MILLKTRTRALAISEHDLEVPIFGLRNRRVPRATAYLEEANRTHARGHANGGRRSARENDFVAQLVEQIPKRDVIDRDLERQICVIPFAGHEHISRLA